MSCCGSCNQPIVNDMCGCGCGTCKPWASPISGFHCDPPPSPPPCGYRCEPCDSAPDGFERVPVWHPVHPLIPQAKATCVDLVQKLTVCGCDCDEAIDQKLACELLNGELNTSSCSFPGDRYFQGVVLYASARIELLEANELWLINMRTAAMKGYNFTGKQPKLQDQPSWQLRQELQVRRFAMISNVGGHRH